MFGFKVICWALLFIFNGSKREIVDDDSKTNVSDSLTINNRFRYKQENPKTINEIEEGSVKILGVSWNVDSDEFEYNLLKLCKYAKTIPATKRSVLNLLTKIFGPLGFFFAFKMNP